MFRLEICCTATDLTNNLAAVTDEDDPVVVKWK